MPPNASPTGLPAIPPKVVPYLILIILAAEVAAQMLPPEHIAAKLAHGVVALGAILGLASPGLRRQPPAPVEPVKSDAEAVDVIRFPGKEP